MKSTATSSIAIVSLLTISTTSGFSTHSSSTSSKPQLKRYLSPLETPSVDTSVPKAPIETTTTETTRLQFLQNAFTATTAAATLTFLPQSSSAVSSDPFALPSYSDAVSNKAIEMNLESVNKKILEEAAAKRDDRNVNKENNERFIELKKEEAEEEARMIRLKELAKREREERIAKEKAETKANRWNTF
mmetsp:Transcript_6815/g.8493  ORF Transcript_6815/g.8493 Transcript_6815/m.8493 type:complete len:189 (+) Transcript_6815:158-724(+)|eukprot:CAMPEP_0203636644 /NCGR_PEP_ID=MMETSP0088-20131115/3146_1 /ASSEMBLY_ACC=CAM_ASM_001087 /TAXON_ID=426623 /ORGANISM="Chaetoceros affinis, Strain CCMP159" /LENGTH=188 /DNA_ID=CAMNT_0050490839 /DNA_START=90 /DNA_END=656 /DNA_ORIENTATION=-